MRGEDQRIGSRAIRPLASTSGLMLCAMLAFPRPTLAGLLFNVTYDASVGSAPAGFVPAFTDAIQLFERTYTDPITITMNVGWGEINGNPLNPGNLGQSLTNQPGSFTYAQVKNALIHDAKSAADAAAVATLGADPTGGRAFEMSNAEAKALGLIAGNPGGTDGWVGFDSGASYTFAPNARAVSGKYDFIGIAEHEIAEVMGRYGMTQNGCSNPLCDSPIDLFRYSGAGNFDLNPENGSYFSIDGGISNINTFNGTTGGDLSDWAGLTLDTFNASSSIGSAEPFTAGDRTLMDVIGYDPAAVPEPTTLTLFGAYLIASGVMGRRKLGTA
jgi:hypothetical protein